MVLLDRIHESMENIWDGVGHTAPVRNHGDAEGVFKKAISCERHPSEKDLDRTSLFVAVEPKAVDRRIIFVSTDGFLRGLQVRGAQGFERTF